MPPNMWKPFTRPILIILLLCSGFLSAQNTLHDRAFWQSIGKTKYAVPEHESADALAHELSTLLSSPDPKLRDDLALVLQEDRAEITPCCRRFFVEL